MTNLSPNKDAEWLQIKLEKNQIIYNVATFSWSLITDWSVLALICPKETKINQLGKVADLVWVGIWGLLPPTWVKIVKAQWTENVLDTTL